MTAADRRSVLMLSLHGYVAASPQLGMPDTGGQVMFVLELAKRFARLGHRVDICTRQFGDQPAIEQMGPQLRLLRVPFGGTHFIRKEDMHDYVDEFVNRFDSTRTSSGLCYDVISSHYWDAGAAGCALSALMDVPHIHTPHSLGWWKRKQMRDAGAVVDVDYRFPERLRAEREVYHCCESLIATTDQQKDLLQSAYRVPAAKISVIPPGVDERRFFPKPAERIPAMRRELGFAEHDVYAVGRVAPNKGFDLLIRALAELRKLVPDARLILAVGADSGLDLERVANLKRIAAEQGVASSVEFRGYVPDERMADHYRAAPVFALCSRYEPFGMTAMEAMACGTPTVITIHGGLGASIENGSHALLADPKKPHELAAALALPMLYPKLRTTLMANGADLAKRHYGWTAIAERTLDVLKNTGDRQVEKIGVAPETDNYYD